MQVAADAVRCQYLQTLTRNARGFFHDDAVHRPTTNGSRIEGDVATIGVTDYAQSQLGDVVFVELPKVGRSLKKAEAAAVVESVKAASDVYAPITGEVLEVNDGLVGRARAGQLGRRRQGVVLQVENCRQERTRRPDG